MPNGSSISGFSAGCEGLQECKGCLNCTSTEDDVCNDCQYDISKCKWCMEANNDH